MGFLRRHPRLLLLTASCLLLAGLGTAWWWWTQSRLSPEEREIAGVWYHNGRPTLDRPEGFSVVWELGPGHFCRTSGRDHATGQAIRGKTGRWRVTDGEFVCDWLDDDSLLVRVKRELPRQWTGMGLRWNDGFPIASVTPDELVLRLGARETMVLRRAPARAAP